MSRARTVSTRLSNASSSSKLPGTNRKPSARWRQTSSRNGVRACCLTASYTIWPKSWSAQSRRGEAASEKPGGGRAGVGEADEREARWEQAAVGQVVHGRHQLLAGQVTRDAEDHQAARAGDLLQA